MMASLMLWSPRKTEPDAEQREAISRMEKSLVLLSEKASLMGLTTDPVYDPNATGLIGPEWSEITTTIGHPEAKRSTLQPVWAALMVKLIREAGLQAGDTLAIGSSGSFPALMIASLSAAYALRIHSLTIISIGSSSYGASDPRFTLFDMCHILYEGGLISELPIACSLGGDNDQGEGFDDATRIIQLLKINDSGIPLILEPTLKESVDERMKRYGNGVKLFINAGGNESNLGSSQMVLMLEPGLIREGPLPPLDRQGVIHRYLSQGTPVIHLLNIRELARKYHIPWDPVKNPDPASIRLAQPETKKLPKILLSLAGIAYFAGLMIRWSLLKNIRN